MSELTQLNPTPELLELYEAMKEAQADAHAALDEANRCEEIYERARSEYRKARRAADQALGEWQKAKIADNEKRDRQ